MPNKQKCFLGSFIMAAIILGGFIFAASPAEALDQSDWSRVNQDGFGDANNVGVYSLATFNGELYAGTWNAGSKVYYSSNGTNWTESVNASGGFGDAQNFYIFQMKVFKGKLYAGTRNTNTGIEIWSTANGTDWAQVNTDGFGNSANVITGSMSVFNNELYVGTINNSGAEVWSTADGTNWTSRGNGGLGDVNNVYVTGMTVFNNKLYIGTGNASGAQILSSSNGANWSPEGTLPANNTIIYDLNVFNNELYAAGRNITEGAIVFKSTNGTDWSQANTSGFGDANNAEAVSATVYIDTLYVGTNNTSTGGELWSSTNGTSWSQVNDDGFGSSNNGIVVRSAVFNYKLYAGTRNSATGGEVWSAQVVDSTNPTISSQSPAGGATNVSRSTDISFNANDSTWEIDQNSINVTVEGASAISTGICQSGYSCTIEDDGLAGYNVTVNPDNNFSYSQAVDVVASASDGPGNSASSSWSFTTEAEPGPTLDPKILTTSGPGEITRLQAYDRRGKAMDDEIIGDLFPPYYTGGAGIVPIDQNNNGVKDQFLIFATSNGGPQARVLGLREDGSQYFGGQMFVFQNPGDASTTSSIRDGLSMTAGDFDNDGYEDDVAACLTGDYNPHVKVFKDATGVDNWQLLNQFDAPFGAVGCNLGVFQYDDAAPELLVTPNHGSADPKVYVYTVGGTLKKEFQAYDNPIQQGLTASGIEDRIYTTPNNGTSHVRVFDRNGDPKNFWWAYAEHVRGDFKNVAGDIDLDGKDEILISPIGANGSHVLAFEASGKWRTWPNFFAFGDETLRNGVGIAVIENWHGAN